MWQTKDSCELNLIIKHYTKDFIPASRPTSVNTNVELVLWIQSNPKQSRLQQNFIAYKVKDILKNANSVRTLE